MFPYDPAILETLRTSPQSVQDVIRTMQAIETTCMDADGLKWFNWLYLRVTQAVEDRVQAGGFQNPSWLASLDVQFAMLYFDALKCALSNAPCLDCWNVLFSSRSLPSVARIQFAMAGINAHINHDLPQAIVTTCHLSGSTPTQTCSQYTDYTALNSTLDSLIDSAKQTLKVRLLGTYLPPASHLEDTVAAWNIAAAREAAWQNAEILDHLQFSQPLASSFMGTLDGLTAALGKTLLVPVP